MSAVLLSKEVSTKKKDSFSQCGNLFLDLASVALGHESIVSLLLPSAEANVVIDGPGLSSYCSVDD